MRLWLYCVAGFLFDWLIYLAWIVIPVRAVGMKASSTQLSLLQGASTVIYTTGCLLIGRLADRTSKALLARLSAPAAIVACFAISRAEPLGMLFLAVPLLGFSASLFWPSVQGALGSETDPSRLEKVLGRFNVMWSAGKALGFLFGGLLISRFGAERTLWFAAAAALAIFLTYPLRDAPRAAAPRGEAGPERVVFRTMGYVANFFAHGVGAVFHTQLYKYITERGLGGWLGPKTLFGAFLCMVFAAQTALFWALQRNVSWTYRRGPLYATQILLAAAVGAVLLARNDYLLLGLAPFLGAGLGFAYASSIYYSLHGPGEHGKYSGIHEAVLGTGNFLIAFIGGVTADFLGDVRMPYVVAAAVTLAAIAIEEIVYRTSARSSSNRSILKSAPSSSPGLK